jgi:antitoxin YefM
MANRTSYTQARARLASLCDRVAETREPYVIERRNGENVALISEAELNSLLETAHLLRSPANARRLASALERALGKRPASSSPSSSAGAWDLKSRRPSAPPQRLAGSHQGVPAGPALRCADRRRASRLTPWRRRFAIPSIGKPEPLRFYFQGCWCGA